MKANKTRKVHTQEFKAEALKLAERIGVAAAARELKVYESQLYGLVAKCMTEENLLINVTRDTTVRLLPPLICTDNEIVEMANKLTAVINKTFR